MRYRARWMNLETSAEPPRATRYAELGGSWNSEVNKGNHARKGSVLFDF